MKSKVLITGGAGFIGSDTANELVSHGYKVRVLDNLSRQVHADPKKSLAKLDNAVEFVCGDIRDSKVVEQALEGIEVVYHFSAETGVGQSMIEQERYTDVNITGSAILCDCIVRNKVKLNKLILSSSRAVYGEGPYVCSHCGVVYPETRTRDQLSSGDWDLRCSNCRGETNPLPCPESALHHPVSIYGYTKKVQEDLFKFLHVIKGIPTVILRYFNVFGPGQSVSNPYTGVLSIFSSLMISNKPIEIYEDGRMVRDFVSIKDVVKVNVKALELEKSEILTINVGSGVPRTILQLAKCLKKEIGSKSEISITGRYRIGDIRHCYADISKQNEIFGSFGIDDFGIGIKNLVKWARKEKNEVALEDSLVELSDLGFTDKAE